LWWDAVHTVLARIPPAFQPRPAVRGDGLCIRKTVWLSLTFDHRMVDGAPAARFLQCVRQYVEQPGGILD